MIAAFDRITIDPAVCGGKPCIRGMRFPVYQVVDLVAGGNTFSSILVDYPFLEVEDIQQALSFDPQALKETPGVCRDLL